MDTTRISCTCKVCKANAAKVGLAAPLAADVPAKWDVSDRKIVHGFVTLAHHPVLSGARSVQALGPWAVR